MKHFFALLFLVTTINSTSQVVYKNLEVHLQKELDSIVSSYQLPGITFSILFDDNKQINLASGFADTEKVMKMDAKHKMMSGSVGKLFFGCVVLKLIQEGKLSIDDKVSKYLSNTKWYETFPNNKDIKIVNLLNHTSGLPRHLFQPELLNDFIENPLKKRLPEDCIQSICNKPAMHPVGQGWAYSDTNYILLGLIVEKVTQENFYDIIYRDLIKPLNLELTVPSKDLHIDKLASGYIGAQNPFKLPQKVIDDNGNLVLNPSFEWTGGGFATNPKDLTKLVKYIHESDYLSPEIKLSMKQAVNFATGLPYDYGYGLGTFVWSKMNDTRYGHSGFFPGYVSHVEYSKNRQYAIAIQINNDGAYSYLEQIQYQLEQVVNQYLDKIDEFKIMENFKTQEACWNNQDIECYMGAYATTEPIQTASRGGITYGYDNIIADYKKYFPKDKMGRLHFDTISFRRLSDNLYYVTGRFNLKFEGKDDLYQGWFSVNTKKINGNWFMITDHSS